jgi:hypothetical protein
LAVTATRSATAAHHGVSIESGFGLRKERYVHVRKKAPFLF